MLLCACKEFCWKDWQEESKCRRAKPLHGILFFCLTSLRREERVKISIELFFQSSEEQIMFSFVL